MFLNLFLIAVGIVIVITGADRLTEGAVAIAQKMKIPQIVIGLTIVAMGTSMPEFTVSLLASLKGTPDLAVGNVVGSNTFNTLAIVGIAAMIAPMSILPSTIKKDLPFALVASLLLAWFSFDGALSRIDCGLLLLLFCSFMFITVRGAQQEKHKAAEEQSAKKPMNTLLAVVWMIVGLAALIFGSNLFVNSASAVAKDLGVSEAVIGLTIVAAGTSLPELATSVVAARKGNSGIAIGNVIGSNVFNILFILGLTGVIAPMNISGITQVDFSVMIISMMALWLFSYTKLNIVRWEGAVLTGGIVAYFTYLVLNVTQH